MSKGLKFDRVFSADKLPVREQVEWKTLAVRIPGANFEMPEVEVPAHWSPNAATILAQKYFRKAGVPLEPWEERIDEPGLPIWLRRAMPIPPGPWITDPSKEIKLGCETSAHQVFHRLAGAWTYWGWRMGVFSREIDVRVFYDEVYLTLARQAAAPNSPQWFNTGLHWAYGITGSAGGQWAINTELTKRWEDEISVYETDNAYERPQPHACFIQPVSDDLVNPGGIMDLWTREVRLFKQGSGTGSNFSTIRGKGEPLSNGGVSSGLMSFLTIGDRSAGSIASGGTTRRAAKMVIVDADHPEIEEFVDWKAEEEYKAAAMYTGSLAIREKWAEFAIPPQIRDRMLNGYEPIILDIGWEGIALNSVSGQNANNTVRVTDDFIKQVRDATIAWELKARTTGKPVKTIAARHLWNKIALAAWASADPGLQFHDTINAWHTCPADGEIRASNPCFTGDTKVWTVSGPIRFDELAARGKPVPVLTELSSGKLGYRDMTSARMTQPHARVCEVTFEAFRGPDRKKTITKLRCTLGHKFFLTDGTTQLAIALRPGDRLESAYRFHANQTDWAIRNTSGDAVFESHLVAEYDYGRRPVYPAEHAHHKDEDHSNNTPGNVEILPGPEHNSAHMRGDRNPMRRWFSSLTEAEQKQHRQKMSESTKGNKNGNFGNKGHLSDRQWITDGTQSRRVLRGGDIPAGWRLGRLGGWNHTVVKVQELSTNEDVYCGTVQDSGRFFVALNDEEHQEGVLVKNCSEYMFLDDTACNLASLNLVAFKREDGSIDLEAYQHAIRLWTVVLDISVEMASFPSREIAIGTWKYRTLGLGYMNLGGLLMRLAIPYDSDEGRALAAALTALLTGVAYLTSAELAQALGPFPRWEANKANMRRVLHNHAVACHAIKGQYEELAIKPIDYREGLVPSSLNTCVKVVWEQVADGTLEFRNAQVSVLAPTGTISLVTDCDTSGVEPDFSLIKHKQLAGGGDMNIVNEAVPEALRVLGLPEQTARCVLDWISENLSDDPEKPRLRGTVEGCPSLPDKYMAVFDCATPPPGYTRCLESMAHVRMVAAVQPFLSGSASKTVNMPATATVEDVSHIYAMAHALGLKAVSIYRDGSKLTQPLASAAPRARNVVQMSPVQSTDGQLPRGVREFLPWRREDVYLQKVKIGDQSVFFTVSNYPDGRPGECFIELAREGSTMRAMGNMAAMLISIGLQYGVPPEEYVDKLAYLKFEPAGPVEGHLRIKMVSSIADYIGREFGLTYLGMDELAEVQPAVAIDTDREVVALDKRAIGISLGYSGEVCKHCGGYRVTRSGSCSKCHECGTDTGCG